MLKKLITIIVLPCLAASFFAFQIYQNSIEGFEDGTKVPVFFEYGTPLKSIIKTLKEKEIIEYEWPMLVYLKWYEKGDNLQAGDFILHKGTPIPELTDILSNSTPKEIPLRVIEGRSTEEIDILLTEKGLIDGGDFISCMKSCTFPEFDFLPKNSKEGFLFPDTYFVATQNFDVKSFISRMIQNFENRFLYSENKQKILSQSASIHEIVIMASIIELEERNTTNMPTISGILWKRLNERIPLGADATTRYYEKNKTGVLTRADFEKDNPFNTRRNLGLPPSAIGNPGLKALNAALYPEKSSYYYYLHDNSGNIHYGKTNEEHNVNKWKYLR